MDNIKDIVTDVIGKLASKKIDEGSKVERIWQNIMEKDEIKHTKILGINEGKISVLVDSPAWLYQMKMKKRKILQQLMDEVPEVKQLTFKIGKIK